MEKEKLDSTSTGYMGLAILLAFLAGGILMLVMFNQVFNAMGNSSMDHLLIRRLRCS